MLVENVHGRTFPVECGRVGELIDGLATREDPLWPHERWPAMRFDRALGVGATGGHGPVRYHVTEYEPAHRIRFTFIRPRGLHGYHEWEVRPARAGCELRHVLAADTTGLTVVSWPLVWRPMHDALIEDALDKAARNLGAAVEAAPWTWHVRALRRAATVALN